MRDVDLDSPSVPIAAVEFLNRKQCFAIVLHQDKTETAAASSLMVGDYLRARDGAVLLKALFKCGVVRGLGKVCDEKIHWPNLGEWRNRGE
jgi:hypothetical protein